MEAEIVSIHPTLYTLPLRKCSVSLRFQVVSKRSPKILVAYKPDRLDQMLELIARAGREPPHIALERLRTVRKELEQDLLSLIDAVGIAHDGSEASLIWHELDGETPSHRQMATWFKAMAKAARPLDPKVCRLELWPELNALIRARWRPRWKREGRNFEPSLRKLHWETLTGPEQEEIRGMARILARRHSAAIRQGAEQKTDVDTVLAGLADIFLRYAQRPDDRFDLAHARGSHFTKFAVLALERAGAYGEFSANALSNRWARLLLSTRSPARRIRRSVTKTET